MTPTKEPLDIEHLSPWGVDIASHRHEKSGAVQLHRHPYPSLIVVTDGQGGIYLGDENFPLYQDMAVIVPPHLPHETYDHPGHPMNVFSVGFDIAYKGISDDAYQVLIQRKRPLSLPVYAARQIQTHMRTLLHEQNLKAPQFEVVMQSSLCQLLTLLYRSSLQEKPLGSSGYDSIHKVREVLRDLETNYHQHNNLGDVAKMAHLSQRQFSNLCNQITGHSYVSWINHIRCQKAKDLLQETEMPVSSIAFEVGFEELSTFYRAFKKAFDMAPKAFRAK
jgi:AraC family L-rhamnose operon regulatory protein RhaS